MIEAGELNGIVLSLIIFFSACLVLVGVIRNFQSPLVKADFLKIYCAGLFTSDGTMDNVAPNIDSSFLTCIESLPESLSNDHPREEYSSNWQLIKARFQSHLATLSHSIKLITLTKKQRNTVKLTHSSAIPKDTISSQIARDLNHLAANKKAIIAFFLTQAKNSPCIEVPTGKIYPSDDPDRPAILIESTLYPDTAFVSHDTQSTLPTRTVSSIDSPVTLTRRAFLAFKLSFREVWALPLGKTHPGSTKYCQSSKVMLDFASVMVPAACVIMLMALYPTTNLLFAILIAMSSCAASAALLGLLSIPLKRNSFRIAPSLSLRGSSDDDGVALATLVVLRRYVSRVQNCEFWINLLLLGPVCVISSLICLNSAFSSIYNDGSGRSLTGLFSLSIALLSQLCFILLLSPILHGMKLTFQSHADSCAMHRLGNPLILLISAGIDPTTTPTASYPNPTRASTLFTNTTQGSSLAESLLTTTEATNNHDHSEIRPVETRFPLAIALSRVRSRVYLAASHIAPQIFDHIEQPCRPPVPISSLYRHAHVSSHIIDIAPEAKKPVPRSTNMLESLTTCATLESLIRQRSSSLLLNSSLDSLSSADIPVQQQQVSPKLLNFIRSVAQIYSIDNLLFSTSDCSSKVVDTIPWNNHNAPACASYGNNWPVILTGLEPSKDGRLVCKDKHILERQKGVSSEVMKKSGKSIMSGDFSQITLPMRIFEPTTYLHRIAAAWSFAPIYLNKAAALPASRSHDLDRLKHVIAFVISGLHMCAGQLKPFPAQLGETLQAKIGNIDVYCEQVSYSPAIMSFNLEGPELTETDLEDSSLVLTDDENQDLIGKRSFFLFGHIETGTEVSRFGNQVTMTHRGSVEVQFAKSRHAITYVIPDMTVQGLLMGSRTCVPSGVATFVDSSAHRVDLSFGTKCPKEVIQLAKQSQAYRNGEDRLDIDSISSTKPLAGDFTSVIFKDLNRQRQLEAAECYSGQRYVFDPSRRPVDPLDSYPIYDLESGGPEFKSRLSTDYPNPAYAPGPQAVFSADSNRCAAEIMKEYKHLSKFSHQFRYVSVVRGGWLSEVTFGSQVYWRIDHHAVPFTRLSVPPNGDYLVLKSDQQVYVHRESSSCGLEPLDSHCDVSQLTLNHMVCPVKLLSPILLASDGQNNHELLPDDSTLKIPISYSLILQGRHHMGLVHSAQTPSSITLPSDSMCRLDLQWLALQDENTAEKCNSELEKRRKHEESLIVSGRRELNLPRLPWDASST